MKTRRNAGSQFLIWRFSFFALVLLLSPCPVQSQDFPTKPISLYLGYDAGASSDITARALASEVEKLLGVPIVAENKPGGGSTVCASLISAKKPDGYTIGLASSQVITVNPHLMSLSYDPLKDFTPLFQYSFWISGLLVLNDSPFKNAQDLISYAKTHPGMSYGSTGIYGQSHLSTFQFANCKGLQFKHVPFKGASAACTALLGKHVDLVTSGDRCINYVKKGVMRLLINYNMDTRDPEFPDIPVLKELDCKDVPPNRIFIFGPKGIPEAVSTKLVEAFKKASLTPKFQKLLKDLDLPYEFKDRKQLEAELPKEHEAYKTLLNAMGVKKGAAP